MSNNMHCITARAARVGLVVFLLAAAAATAPAAELSAAERQKVEALIKHVEGLRDARFVRNGSEYDTATAVRFLRGKWEASAAEIKTAKDFIDKAASVSSTTGRPYLVRFRDGKEVKAGDYLRAELKKLEAGPTEASRP
jgi:hypothetical protein